MVIIDTLVNTLFGGLTVDPAGMHCPSWDDAFVSSCITFDFRIRREGCKNHLLPIREAIGAIGDFNESFPA